MSLEGRNAETVWILNRNWFYRQSVSALVHFDSFSLYRRYLLWEFDRSWLWTRQVRRKYKKSCKNFPADPQTYMVQVFLSIDLLQETSSISSATCFRSKFYRVLFSWYVSNPAIVAPKAGTILSTSDGQIALNETASLASRLNAGFALGHFSWKHRNTKYMMVNEVHMFIWRSTSALWIHQWDSLSQEMPAFPWTEQLPWEDRVKMISTCQILFVNLTNPSHVFLQLDALLQLILNRFVDSSLRRRILRPGINLIF